MRKKTGAFRVVTGTYVTTDVGTGVVHQAPYFGEVRVLLPNVYHIPTQTCTHTECTLLVCSLCH